MSALGVVASLIAVLVIPPADSCIRTPPRLEQWTTLKFEPPSPKVNSDYFQENGFDITCSNINVTKWGYQNGMGLQYFNENSGSFQYVVFTANRKPKHKWVVWTDPGYFRDGNAVIIRDIYAGDHKGRELTIRVRPLSTDKLLRYRCRSLGINNEGQDVIDYSKSVYYY